MAGIGGALRAPRRSASPPKFCDAVEKCRLMEGLLQDIARVTRQRELLVQHISARLGTVSAEQPAPAKEERIRCGR